MHKGIATVYFIAAIFIAFSLGTPISSNATVFWNEGFENQLYPNWTGGGGCITAGSPDGVACSYPQITTSLAFAGTHSLLSHYASSDQQAGTFMDRAIPETVDLWTRQYARWNNFVFGPQNDKFFLTGGPENGVGVYWLHQNAGPELHAQVYHPTTVTCPNGNRDITCNYTPNIAHIALNDNKWHCIETRQNSGTANTANGLVELYIDGVLTTRYTNLLMKSTAHGITMIRAYAQNGKGDRYQDDWAVGNSRIGCSGSPSPSTTTPPPATPTGLVIQ
ncbi:MAG: hypothetical protein OJF50_000454 [Nitrospira sp.]|jgi:hypothetical protein|nr:hypothetical protein [Nitrospira sp.]